MPSFSKAIAYLTAFAATSSTTTTTVDAACECVGPQKGTAKIFADYGYSSDFGANCRGNYPTFGHPCAVGGEIYKSDYCNEPPHHGPWCYVGADSTCDDLLKTVTFADTSVGDTLQSSVSACGIDTCGQCLPIMEGDDAVIGVRLYKTSSTEEYLALADAIASPFFSSQPGFISYTGVQTQDPEIVMFMSIYDTVENSAAAYEKMKKSIQIPLPSERLMNYYGTITWTGDDPGGDKDCVKAFDVGDYLSARMHYGDDRQHGIALTGGSYKIFSGVESFDSYTSSKGLGEYDTDSFFFETFNDEDDSTAANALLVSGTALNPTISLIYNVVGQVVFDSTCSNDYPIADYDYPIAGYEEPTEVPTSEGCETFADIIRSNPHLGHFANLFEVAINVEGSSMYDAYTRTIFAPTDEAIEDAGLVIDAVSDDSAIMLLLFHEVFDEALAISDLNCDAGDNLIMMDSGQATRTICNFDRPIGQKGGGNDTPALFVGDAIVGCDGVVQIIDKVLLPPSNVRWYSGLDLP